LKINLRIQIILFIALCFGWQNSNFGQVTESDSTNSAQSNNSSNQTQLLQLYEQYAANGGPLIDFDFNKKYDPQAIKWDLKVLQTVLEEAKTGLGSVDQDRLKNAFLSANESAADSLSYMDFVRVVARVFNAVSCGHSGLSHHPDYYYYRQENMLFFPLDIYTIDDRYFIKSTFSFDMRPRPYDEILSLNGQTPAEISKILQQHMALDGMSAADGTALVQSYFTMAYSNFLDNPSLFNITLKSYGSGRESTFDFKPLHLISLDANRTKRNKGKVTPKPLQFEIDKANNAAVYTIKSFNNQTLAKNDQEFYAFTDSIFGDINTQGIGNLIIDLRGNMGGWTANGAHLFSYFINAPQAYINSVETVKYKDYSFAPIITSEPGYLDTFQMEKLDNGRYSWVNYPSLRVNPASKNKFSGKCYILIDDLTRSSAAVFSALMDSHTKAIFIGHETGGSQSDSHGMVMGIQLPYTGLMIHFATAKYSLNVKDPSNIKGVIPDHQVANTLEDYKNGVDSQLKKALELIGQQK
jgi:hypothetical protein